MATVTITFRAHKNLKSWLDYAGQGFDTPGELPRLLVTRAATDQASDTGITRKVKGLLSRRRAVDVGNTAVYSVRLPQEMADLARSCADYKGVTLSEWCAGVFLDWWQRFIAYKEEQGGQLDLLRYADAARLVVKDSLTVYAEKQGKQGIGA